MISNQSRQSFGRVSKRSWHEIRSHMRSISQEKSRVLLKAATPLFKPSINDPQRLYDKKKDLLGLSSQDWVAKTHIERLSEDLEKRKQNLNRKMKERKQAEKEVKGD